MDDLRGLSPPQKVIGQVLAACTLVSIEALLGTGAWVSLSIPMLVFLVLWLVAIMNAFNLLDNTDGLAAVKKTLQMRMMQSFQN